MVKEFEGRGRDPHYLGYFGLFNQGHYYEAHDALEQLWLPQRQGANGAFYKGLIQLAGAFVHLQKQRLRPAAALFKLARTNFERYASVHEELSLAEVQVMIGQYLKALEAGAYEVNPLSRANPPRLVLMNEGGAV